MNKNILLIVLCFLFAGCIAEEIDMFDNKKEVIIDPITSKEDKLK